MLKESISMITFFTVLVIFEGQDLQQLPEKEMRTIRGGKMSMIFQEPMSSLNPAMRIDKQMIEGIRLHSSKSSSEKFIRFYPLLNIRYGKL